MIKYIKKYIAEIEKNYLRSDLPIVNTGDTVNIGFKLIEGNKERIQFYEGIVLAKKNFSVNTTLFVYRVFQGIGITRLFLLNSPKIKSIEVLKSFKVSKSKIYNIINKKPKVKNLKQKLK
jgi:large subunit ribosomal protein L19